MLIELHVLLHIWLFHCTYSELNIPYVNFIYTHFAPCLWIALWGINSTEEPPIAHFPRGVAGSAESLNIRHPHAKEKAFGACSFYSHALAFYREECVYCTRVSPCVLPCVYGSWPLQSTAVPFNNTDEEQRPWFQFQTRISHQKLLFIF